MKSIQIFALVFLAALLLMPASAQQSRGQVIEPAETHLITVGDPALKSVDDFQITVNLPDDPNLKSSLQNKLLSNIENRLGQNDIKEPILNKIALPALTIDIETLKIDKCDLYVFRIQTSMMIPLSLPKSPRYFVKSPVWKTEPVMKAVAEPNLTSEISSAALKQIDTFINAWKASHSQMEKPKALTIAPAAPVKTEITSQPDEYEYIASKNSTIFHHRSCAWAEKIKPENLVRYKTREDAIKDGKRPCKTCKP